MNKLKKVYIIISGILLIIVLFALSAEIIAYTKLSNLQATVAEQIYYNDKLEEKEKILSDLSDNFSEIEGDKEIILETLPEDKDASKLVSDLNSIANKSDYKFTSVESSVSIVKGGETKKTDPSLLQTIKGDYGYEMPLTIIVEGPYSKFVSFVEGIESYQRLINITSVKIEELDEETRSDYIEATLDITAYLKR